MVFYADKHELFDGECLLYRRVSGTEIHRIWQMRLKPCGSSGYVIKSCKTDNYEKAIVAAKTELDRLKRRIADGAPLKDWTFADHWKDWFDREVRKGTWKTTKQKWHQSRYDLYFSRYFGDKPLNDLTTDFANDYWEWRVNFWESDGGKKLRTDNPKRRYAKTKTTGNAKSKPANRTLLMERTVLHQILADANDRKRLQHVVRIKTHRTSHLDTRRPAFDEVEWTVLTDHLNQWALGRGPYETDRLNSHHLVRRKQIRAYVLIMASSGLRVGEARVMRWADIGYLSDSRGQPVFTIKVRENTKRGARIVVPMRNTYAYFAEWHVAADNKLPQDLVFTGHGTGAATDLNKSFQSFLRTVPYHGRTDNLLCDADGNRRTIYSLRHTYATLVLLRGELTELSLARNMGTSVAQIEKHYSHVTNMQKADKFSSVRLPGLDQSIDGMLTGSDHARELANDAFQDEFARLFPDDFSDD